MTVKKLSDADKSEILDLYRKTGETTSTLAERYGVSNSTISRFLKSTLQEEEYEALIQQKRAARTSVADARQTLLFNESELDSVEDTTPTPILSAPEPESVVKPLVEVVPRSDIKPTPAAKQIQLRSSAAPQAETQTPVREEVQPPDDTTSDIAATTPKPNENVRRISVRPSQTLAPRAAAVSSSSSAIDEDSGAQANAVAQMLGEDLLDEDSEDLTDLDDDEDLEDLEDLDEDDLDEDMPIITRRVRSETLVQVLPLSEATLPRTCYLVIDRASELITRPLRDFGDLGQIPTQEVQQKTLPVFDNHRVARRFSTKRDRVIKIPDSRVLQKTRSHLQAKGITRLLVDGQVYSLSGN